LQEVQKHHAKARIDMIESAQVHCWPILMKNVPSRGAAQISSNRIDI